MMQTISALLGIGIAALVIWYFISRGRQRQQMSSGAVLTDADQQFFEDHISFYQKLTTGEKGKFRKMVNEFLAAVTITGVKTEVTQQDRLMVAAGAVIPIFRFNGWQYRNVHEVLIYPDMFSKEFAQQGNERNVLGMVGEGPMQNVMVLSQPALRHDFLQQNPTGNTAIHEFVHLLDKSDGATDGLPENLLPPASVKPWLQWMHKETELIKANQSDINDYAATNEAEFLAVASEYFFTQPEKLQQHHPELYNLLCKIFNTPVGTEGQTG